MATVVIRLAIRAVNQVILQVSVLKDEAANQQDKEQALSTPQTAAYHVISVASQATLPTTAHKMEAIREAGVARLEELKE